MIKIKVDKPDSALAMMTYSPGTSHYNIRTHTIDTITIHHSANGEGCEKGYSPGTLGVIFSSVDRAGSCHYGIDSAGRIGQMLPEKYRSWCSDSPANDMRAVTIEVANCGGAPTWEVSPLALSAIIHLCTDICRRCGKTRMRWIDDKDAALKYEPDAKTMRMTLHKWLAYTICPGPYLSGQMSYIAQEVTKALGGSVPIYRVRKSWADSKSQIGAFTSLEYAKAICKNGYSVFDDAGNVVYSRAQAKSVEDIAREVIRGEWGAGGERKTRLTAAGYDYSIVQAMVNKMLK